MGGLEYFRNVSIGQYLDTHSVVHGFTPSTKYLGFFLFMLLALSTPGIFGIAVLTLFVLGTGAAARVKPSFFLRGIVPALPYFMLAAILQLLFSWSADTSEILFEIWRVSVTVKEVWTALIVVLRSSCLIMLIGLFTSVTCESEIAHGLEDAFAPLALIGLPSHGIALAATTAFRFVPIVVGELESIVRAQASRGADFGTGRGGPLAKTKAYLPLFVPVTIRSLERAQALAEAMEARCYTEKGRTRYKGYPMVKGENAVRAALALTALGALALDIFIFNTRIRPF